MACLLMSYLRTEIDVNHIAAFGSICHWVYSSSLPMGSPKSIFSGKFSSVT